MIVLSYNDLLCFTVAYNSDAIGIENEGMNENFSAPKAAISYRAELARENSQVPRESNG